MTVNIDIESIGPVEEFSYEMEEPGLHVLRGAQGAGKTTILRTVQLATDGKTDVKPTKKDGAKRGVATVAGKTVKIARTVREEGELDVEGLGDLDLNMLHSPKFNDATTRDKYRIKTLARLAGAEADVSMFYDLLGGEDRFAEVVDVESVECDDLVEMAAKVKRAIDKKALEEEKAASAAQSDHRSKMDQVNGVDLDAPHDESELNAALSDAVAQHSRLVAQREDALKVISDARVAKERLDNSDVIDIEDAERELESAKSHRSDCEGRVREIERQLEQARSDLDVASVRVQSAESQVESSRKFARMMGEWKDAIRNSENVECPSEEDVQLAADKVQSAREAQALGVEVRNALSAKQMADEYLIKSNQHEKNAERLRKAASESAEVVSSSIGRLHDCPLRVSYDDSGNARLVIETDRSDSEPFDELSDGERWKAILPLAFRSNRLVVLSQSAFGEISPKNRELIDRLAKEHGCYVLTAQVDDGQLRGEAYLAACGASA